MMCIALLAVEVHPLYPLVVLTNRDEFFDRPTEPMSRWGDQAIIAGKDLKAGGTWLGVNGKNHIALLTNYREPPEAPARNGPSRGELVSGFLSERWPDFQGYLEQHGSRYAGFNIIFGTVDRLVHFSNRSDDGFTNLRPGLHGLSNALLNTPWPKVTRGKALLERALKTPELEVEALFAVLADSKPSPPAQLPSTGLSSALEQRLSSIRILEAGGYGSRSASVVLADRDGVLNIWERAYDQGSTVSLVSPP